MNLEEILVKVQDAVYSQTAKQLNYDDVLMENGIDSVSIIELIMNIEELFSMEFESSKLNYKLLKSIRTIGEHVYFSSQDGLHE